MYQIIYDFISQHLIGSVSVGLDTYYPYLCIILTHVSIVLIFVCCVLLIVWLFRLVDGLLK